MIDSPELQPLMTELQTGGSRIVAVGGFPAAGKTTLCSRLAAAVPNSTFISKDDVLSAYVESAMSSLTGDPHDRDSEEFRTIVQPVVFSSLTGAARLLRDCGLTVFIDSPFIEQARTVGDTGISLSEAILDDFGLAVDYTVWIDVPARVQYENMVRRGSERDVGKLADFAAYRESVESGLPNGTLPPGAADVVIEVWK